MHARLVKIVTFLTLTAVLISACAAQTPQVIQSQPSVAAALPPPKVILMTGTEEIAWKQMAEEYKKETGKTVVIEGQGRGEYHAALPTQLLGGSSSFDIAMMLDTWIPEFAKAGVLLPLDDYIAKEPDFNPDDLLPVGFYEGKRYAVPADFSHFYLYYRSDLIQEPPQTWDEVEALARKFSKATNPASPTKYGITGDYITGEVLPQTWLNFLWPMGGDLLDKSGKVVVNNDAGIKAAEMWARWAKDGLVAPNITQIGWDDQIAQFVNGDAAMIVPGWNAAFSSIPAAKGPFSDKWKAVLLPGVKQPDGSIKRDIYAQSWSWGVNKKGPNVAEAVKFLLWGTSKKGMTTLANQGLGMPSRLSVLKDPALLEKRPDFKLASETFPYVRFAPQVTYWGSIFEAMDIALSDISNQKQDPKAALDEAARKIEQAQK